MVVVHGGERARYDQGHGRHTRATLKRAVPGHTTQVNNKL